MADIKPLIAALVAEDYDVVLKGTEYADCFACDVYDETHLKANERYFAAKKLTQDKLENAARAHVLTLLVGEMEGALKKVLYHFAPIAGDNHNASDAHQELAAEGRANRVLQLAAMLTHPTQQAEEK